MVAIGVTTTTDSFAKKADAETTVATGALVNKDDAGSGDMVAIGVTTTTDSFAKKSDQETTVATGELTDGNDIVIGVDYEVNDNIAEFGGTTSVATGYLTDSYLDNHGDNIADAIGVETVENLVIDDNYAENIDIIIPSYEGDYRNIRVLSGITSTVSTKDVTLIPGTELMLLMLQSLFILILVLNQVLDQRIQALDQRIQVLDQRILNQEASILQ